MDTPFGVEDARLTRIDDRFYFTYVAVSEHGVVTSLASTADFKSFERHGVIFCPENKDVVLFPEKIDHQYVALHRPSIQSHFGTPEIWIARSPDLCHWGSHRRLLGEEVVWATAKIGSGTPPIRTDRGWLTLFHGHARPDAGGGVGEYAAAYIFVEAVLRNLREAPRPPLLCNLFRQFSQSHTASCRWWVESKVKHST